ncbi:MAG TPA: glycosyltransferase family 2 protein [Actinomycetota bacterium]|nr:glycosyltransferase family 2 protein [Actinomycetota bacterium]
MTVSAVVIAMNERDMIAAAIASCRFADEILVVDGGSIDGTQDIARTAGARVVERPFDDFARQRSFALSEAAGEWVLFVDADERVTPALAREILAAVAGSSHAGYKLPRRNMVLGRWLDWHFGGEDAPVRLVRRAVARLQPQGVHEVIEVDGSVGALTNKLVHLTHRSVTDLVDKINRYSSIEAAELAAKGARAPTRRAIAASFPKAFVRYWRSGLGKEDTVGAIEAALLAFNRTLVLAKLWEQTRAEPMEQTYAKAEAEATR